MATKTISVMEDAYEMLAIKKQKNESFSELIRRVFGKKTDIMRFAGSWKDIPDERIEQMKKSIRELKRGSTEELLAQYKK